MVCSTGEGLKITCSGKALSLSDIAKGVSSGIPDDMRKRLRDFADKELQGALSKEDILFTGVGKRRLLIHKFNVSLAEDGNPGAAVVMSLIMQRSLCGDSICRLKLLAGSREFQSSTAFSNDLPGAEAAFIEVLNDIKNCSCFGEDCSSLCNCSKSFNLGSHKFCVV